VILKCEVRYSEDNQQYYVDAVSGDLETQ